MAARPVWPSAISGHLCASALDIRGTTGREELDRERNRGSDALDELSTVERVGCSLGQAFDLETVERRRVDLALLDVDRGQQLIIGLLLDHSSALRVVISDALSLVLGLRSLVPRGIAPQRLRR